jgi:hypothetical protein
MSEPTTGAVTAEYRGGPLDGVVVDVPLRAHRWARYTDPQSGAKHFYELLWQNDGYVFVHRPNPEGP